MSDPETTARSLARAADEARAVFARIAEEAGPALEQIVEGCVRSLAAGNKLLFAGNGGSAAQCQHLSTELVCRFSRDRAPYAAIALTTDTSFLTACANDLGFERVFARQIEALGEPGDVLTVLSTSGRSANLLRAVEAAHAGGIATYALCGGDGGLLAERADVAIVVSHGDTARIQEAHLFLGHLLCAAIERHVGGFGTDTAGTT
jgi:D-sedoheptulose 7-phosphate isomerase